VYGIGLSKSGKDVEEEGGPWSLLLSNLVNSTNM
jgi:hypothetical protein